MPCSVLWFVLVPCFPVLCPVMLCFRVVLCCGALLSIFLSWRRLFVLCPVLGRCLLLPVLCFPAPSVRCFPVLCPVASVALVAVLWCCLWFLVVRCWFLLSAVVSWLRAAASASLSGRVARCPAAGCGFWLCLALLRCVLWCCAIESPSLCCLCLFALLFFEDRCKTFGKVFLFCKMKQNYAEPYTHASSKTSPRRPQLTCCRPLAMVCSCY